MNFSNLPHSGQDFIGWSWDQIQPYFDDLAARPIDAASVDAWLADWNCLAELLDEAYTRLFIASTRDTSDKHVEARLEAFNQTIKENAAKAEQALKDKLLTSGLTPSGFDVPLAKMRLQAGIYRAENLPLLSEDLRLTNEYYKIRGAQTIEWDGERVPTVQVLKLLEESDRSVRERAFRLRLDAWRADFATIDDVWLKMLRLRRQVAENAGMDYRAYRWKQMLRLDYTPDDALRFHDAIEEVVVPAAVRLYEKRRARLGLDRLEPWDLAVDQFNAPPLKPYDTIEDLTSRAAAIFRQVDPELADYFDIMRREDLLDLEPRLNKAPGGFMLPLEVVDRPFIFFSAAGTTLDVASILHEGGHAFHTFEMARQPYLVMRGELGTPMEFAEVASIGMELLALPYIDRAYGGYYTPEQLARARYRYFEEVIQFWPYMSVMDSYQHWVYLHLDEAEDIAACDAAWRACWDRFMKGVSWYGGGADDFVRARWRVQGHLYDSPFYYVEYGLAQLGAVQVWANSLKDHKAAVAQYRSALRLGGSRRLPDLYAAAGVRLAFDAATLRQAVDLIEEEMARAEAGL